MSEEPARKEERCAVRTGEYLRSLQYVKGLFGC